MEMQSAMLVAIVSFIGALIIAGIGWLLVGQTNTKRELVRMLNHIREEAKEGRKVLHEHFNYLEGKVLKDNDRLLKIETEHKMNHGGHNEDKDN